MSQASSSTTQMKKTLGLTGVTVNAMALIAPGAFLWMTYQLQAANTDVLSKSDHENPSTYTPSIALNYRRKQTGEFKKTNLFRTLCYVNYNKSGVI